MKTGPEFSCALSAQPGELTHDTVLPQVTPAIEFSWFQENSPGAQEDQGRQFSCLVPSPRGQENRRTRS